MTAAFTPSHRGGSGSPLVLIHGFTDTWRTWELILPELEKQHDVFAFTLPGHAGGPELEGEISEEAMVDQVERMLDDAGIETAHIAGNSLGGLVTLQLASRGRAKSAVALAPAGGWAVDDLSYRDTLGHFTTMAELLQAAAPHADAIVATDEGRRQATQFIATNYKHIPPELLAHQIRAAAACTVVAPLIDYALREGWSLDAEKISCPVRMVWGTDDQLLRWPTAAVRFRDDWLPHADWVELDGIGHCPQLDVPVETAQLILGFTND